MEEHSYESEDPQIQRSSSSASSVDNDCERIVATEPTLHAPTPIHPARPSLSDRRSSGTIIVPRDSSAATPIEVELGLDDVRSMSPRRTSEDIEILGKEAREELRKYAKALQESLHTIVNRIEAVREEHDKLESNNKFLQQYIGDLMSTSKITASGSKSKK